MSYSRWFHANWYIFWDSGRSDEAGEPALSIWHNSWRDSDELFYATRSRLLKAQKEQDYSFIPGYPDQSEIVDEAIEDFLIDTEQDSIFMREKK